MIPTFQIFSDKKSCVRLSWQEKLDRARARTDSGTSSLCGFGVLNWIAKESRTPLKIDSKRLPNQSIPLFSHLL